MLVDEVAAALGVSHRTIWRAVRQRGLPSHRVGPNSVRYLMSEVYAWLEQQDAQWLEDQQAADREAGQ